jgi:hypothetical protein
MSLAKLAYLICVLPSWAFSQQFYPGSPQYKAESNLVILRFFPGSKSGKIFLAGTKVADLDFSKDAKNLSVVMLNDSKKEILKLNGNGDYYEVESAATFPTSYQILVNAEVRGKLQELKLKVPNTKP